MHPPTTLEQMIKYRSVSKGIPPRDPPFASHQPATAGDWMNASGVLIARQRVKHDRIALLLSLHSVFRHRSHEPRVSGAMARRRRSKVLARRKKMAAFPGRIASFLLRMEKLRHEGPQQQPRRSRRVRCKNDLFGNIDVSSDAVEPLIPL